MGEYKMDGIKVDDKVVYKINRVDGTQVRSEISTVLKIGERGWYLVTHPKLMTPEVGRWVHKTDIIEKVE